MVTRISIGKLFRAIQFADDQAMLADTTKGLQRIMDILTVIAEKFRMNIDTKKTKDMTVSKGAETNLVEVNCFAGSNEGV